MKTLIFDIDGTLTDVGLIETAVYTAMPQQTQTPITKTDRRLLYAKTFRALNQRNLLPKPTPYNAVEFIKTNATRYRFVYATGGQRIEAEYVLRKLGIIEFFDLKNSIDIDACRFSKKTGIPFKRIARLFPDSMVITDSAADAAGAQKANLPTLLIKPNAKIEIT